MDATATLYDWAAGTLVPRDDCEVVETELLAADSSLVASGRTLALGLHRARFAEAAAVQGYGDRAAVDAFWEAGVALLPDDGRWFPRFELVRVRGALRLRLRLRSAPPLGTELVVATAASDPRRAPHLKGPDIGRLNVLRQHARREGAQEAVILDAGRVSDATTAALLWWRGETLYAPPLELARVDSVAARTVRGIAAALGIVVDEEAARPSELGGVTLWAVNSLHGIRDVTVWVDGPALGHDPARTAAWRARFGALARPLR